MVSFTNNGKLKLHIIVGTRPEIIRLAAVIKKCRKYFDTILAHTGRNYDYNLRACSSTTWSWRTRRSIWTPWGTTRARPWATSSPAPTS